MNYNRQHYRLEFTKSRHRIAREEWTWVDLNPGFWN